MIWGGICLMRELECNKALLTMALISGADVSIRHTLHIQVPLRLLFSRQEVIGVWSRQNYCVTMWKLWTAIARVSDVVATRSLRQIVCNCRENRLESTVSTYEAKLFSWKWILDILSLKRLDSVRLELLYIRSDRCRSVEGFHHILRVFDVYDVRCESRIHRDVEILLRRALSMW